MFIYRTYALTQQLFAQTMPRPTKHVKLSFITETLRATRIALQSPNHSVKKALIPGQ